MRNNLFIGFVFITFGLLFLLDNLGIADFGDVIHDFWPLIIIVWGLSILMRNKRSTSEPPPASSTQKTENDSLNESMVFGNLFTNVSSQSFRGGSASTVFGDCHLDLTGIALAEGEHQLRVHGVFGNSTIILPKDCPVAITASSVLGTMHILGQRKEGLVSEIKMSTTNFETSTRRLRITISKVFGNTVIS